MTKDQLLKRKRSVAAAIGSVNAEGIAVPADTVAQLNQYAEGKVTADELLAATLRDIKREPRS